jgi:hypothetical protein
MVVGDSPWPKKAVMLSAAKHLAVRPEPARITARFFAALRMTDAAMLFVLLLLRPFRFPLRPLRLCG